MTDCLENPSLVLKRDTATPSIEVDNDEIEGEYASGAWEDLIPPFTAGWVKRKKFMKTATIWTWQSSSVSFHHPSYSVFIALFGLPMSYFEALYAHVASILGEQVRFSDYVQPNLRDGWRGRIHVQDQATWIPEDETEWSKVKD